MQFNQHAGRRDIGNRGLRFVVPSSHDVALALHHRIETLLGDRRRIAL
jgi:hypothetical protein